MSEEKTCEKSIWERTTLANVTAVVVALGGLAYAVCTGNTEIASFIIGAGVTWLFDQKNSSNGTV